MYKRVRSVETTSIKCWFNVVVVVVNENSRLVKATILSQLGPDG